MSIALAGMLVMFSGIFVVMMVILEVLPWLNDTTKVVFIAIGLTFVVTGAVIRFKALKSEMKQQKELEHRRK